VYEILDNLSDDQHLSSTPNQLWIILSLEIVIGDGLGEYLLLTYPSYGFVVGTESTTDEGYWAPPFIGLPVPITFDLPDTVGAVKRWLNDFEQRIDCRNIMAQLAYALGLTSPEIEFLESFIELKSSPRSPKLVKCYKILRFVVKNMDRKSHSNLADPECRKGYVFLPLREISNLIRERRSVESDMAEWVYLSKPLQSNVRRILSSDQQLQQMRDRAIGVAPSQFFRQEEGLLAAIDLAGYGTACKYATEHMGSFDMSGREIANQFRVSIANIFYQFLARSGIYQVHMAGDGLICGFPKRLFPDGDLTQALDSLFVCYKELLSKVNKFNSCIADPESKVGSRIALHHGKYNFGRVAQARSFGADFDGAAIIEVARLEGALRVHIKNLPKGSHIQHAVACSKALLNLVGGYFSEKSGILTRGELNVSIKEFSAEAAVFELPVEN
jgi:hypothetical protein